MNYQVIVNEQELTNFIAWLPELQDHETFYCCLFARSKYTKHIAHLRSDKAQLKRFTSNKERLLSKIKQLECSVGAYTTKEVGGGQVPVPQEALALYITINPRDMVKANANSVKKLLDLALRTYNGFHPYQEVMSEIQKAKSRSVFVSFDFDIVKDGSTWNNVWLDICSKLNPDAVDVVETRGGYHVLVSVDKVDKRFERTWYNHVSSILATYSSDQDNRGDIMLPVPGTYQGGFSPKMF